MRKHLPIDTGPFGRLFLGHSVGPLSPQGPRCGSEADCVTSRSEGGGPCGDDEGGGPSADSRITSRALMASRWHSLVCGIAGGARTSQRQRTFTIVTTEPSKFAAQFHNRMPLILEPDTWGSVVEGRARRRGCADEACE